MRPIEDSSIVLTPRFRRQSAYGPVRCLSVSPPAPMTDDEFASLEVASVVSELFYSTTHHTTRVIHIIACRVHGSPVLVLHKSSAELEQLNQYVQTVFSTSLSFPPTAQSYPLRDVAIKQFLQEVLTLDNINGALFVRDWFVETFDIRQAVPLHHPVMSGELLKEGYLLKQWKRRFVVVRGGYLFYFVSEKSMIKLEPPRNVISLARACVSHENDVITLSTRKKQVFRFRCEDQSLMNEWLVAFNSFNASTSRLKSRSRFSPETEWARSPDLPARSFSNTTPLDSQDLYSERFTNSFFHLRETTARVIDEMSGTPNSEDVVALLSSIMTLQPADFETPSTTREIAERLASALETSSHLMSVFTLFRETADAAVPPTLTSTPLARSPLTTHRPFAIKSSALPSSFDTERTVCRLCNEAYAVSDLTTHTYYCKICNEICERQSTCKSRLLALAAEIAKQQRIQKGSAPFAMLQQAALACANVDRVGQATIDALLADHRRVAQAARSSTDVCFRTFAATTARVIEVRARLFSDLLLQQPTTGCWAYLSFPDQNNCVAEPACEWQPVGLADFDIIKQFSEGAYSKLYLVRKKTTQDIFALKVSRKADMKRKNVIDGVLNEKRILQLSNTRSVVKLYYAFQDVVNLFLVMDFCPGGDLRCLLRNVVRLSEDVARIYAAEIVLALDYIHSLGCIHRDIKPDNILIDKQGHLLLTDFGLSVVGRYNEQGLRDSRLVCTPDYVAPEALRDCYYCQASDYFSLGCVLYEFVVGVPPFHAASHEDIFARIAAGAYGWPSPDEVNVSPECTDVVAQLLRTDHTARLGATGIDAIKQHPFFAPVNFSSLLSESRDDIFVPELDNDVDTGYFDVSVPNEQLQAATPPQEASVIHEDEFGTFNCVGTDQLLDQNMEIVERQCSVINVLEDDFDPSLSAPSLQASQECGGVCDI